MLNLLRNGVNNVIGMNGTKLPDAIKELGAEKEITLFVDGDRGGKLIIKNVIDNANINYIAIAPDGKEVEELTGKEILMNLRKKIPVSEFLFKNGSEKKFSPEEKKIEKIEIGEKEKSILKTISSGIYGTGKAILLNSSFEEIKSISTKILGSTLRRMREKASVLVIDGTVTEGIISSAEEAGIQVIVAKNFTTTNTSIKLLSL